MTDQLKQAARQALEAMRACVHYAPPYCSYIEAREHRARNAAVIASLESALQQQEPCPKCRDTGWKPNCDANGDRVWLPLVNDALPCECGALARSIAQEPPAPQQEAQGEAVAWIWQYIGKDPMREHIHPCARSLHEMDPKNPPYPETWKPLQPLYATPSPPGHKSDLQAVFLDLLRQVDDFIEDQGEADFYTAPARAMRDLLKGKGTP